MEGFRVGIIGFGGAGQAHYGNFSALDACQVVKIYDPKTAGLDRAAVLAPHVERCADLETFWKGLDVVSICSPDHSHAQYIVAALERDIHVICEKPLTDSVEGIREIKKVEQKSTSVVAVLHQMRFVPLYQKMREILVNEELGVVSYLEGYYVHDLTRRASIYDDWRRVDKATPMVNAGCHFVDLLRWLVNEEIIEVFAAANNLAFPEYPESDINVATLRFRSGILGKVLVTFGSGCPQDHSVRVYGSKGCIDNSALFLRQGKGVGWARTIHKPMLYQTRLAKPRSWVGQMLWASGMLRHHRPRIQNLRAFAVATLVERLRRALPPGGEYGIRHYPIRLYEHSFACQQAIANFLDAIRGSKKPMCSIDEGARTVLACLAAVESYRTNRPVSVPSLDSIL